jgi:hypothetical protein
MRLRPSSGVNCSPIFRKELQTCMGVLARIRDKARMRTKFMNEKPVGWVETARTERHVR